MLVTVSCELYLYYLIFLKLLKSSTSIIFELWNKMHSWFKLAHLKKHISYDPYRTKKTNKPKNPNEPVFSFQVFDFMGYKYGVKITYLNKIMLFLFCIT